MAPFNCSKIANCLWNSREVLKTYVYGDVHGRQIQCDTTTFFFNYNHNKMTPYPGHTPAIAPAPWKEGFDFCILSLHSGLHTLYSLSLPFVHNAVVTLLHARRSTPAFIPYTSALNLPTDYGENKLHMPNLCLFDMLYRFVASTTVDTHSMKKTCIASTSIWCVVMPTRCLFKLTPWEICNHNNK